MNSPARHPLPRAESIFVLGRVLLLILSATVPPGVSLRAADSAPVPLRDARQVLGLSAEELKAEHPVQLRLVVAHVDAQYGLLFGVDATAGLYLSGMGKTFDGKHPCSMCLKIRKGWHEEKQREAQLPLIKMEKMSEALWEFRCLKIPAAPTFALCEQLFVAALYTDFIDSTPTPPPRFVFCVL